MGRLLEGKAAVVTGAGGGGIGEAVALALAAEGAGVVVNDIKPDLAASVAGRIREAGGTAVANSDSVADMASAANIIKTAVESFGRVDILVNCAGNIFPVRSFEMTEEQWDSVVSVHLKGSFACIRAAIPHMIAQRWGRIINISSRAAFFGFPGLNPAYAAAKAGILGLTSVLAADLAEFGITVNAVVPSARTKLFPQPAPTRGADGLPVPLSRDPEYVAPLIVYLASDEAKSVTGRFIYIAGGDLCLYARPWQLGGRSHVFVRKVGKWSPEELAQMVPSLLD